MFKASQKPQKASSPAVVKKIAVEPLAPKDREALVRLVKSEHQPIRSEALAGGAFGYAKLKA